MPPLRRLEVPCALVSQQMSVSDGPVLESALAEGANDVETLLDGLFGFEFVFLDLATCKLLGFDLPGEGGEGSELDGRSQWLRIKLFRKKIACWSEQGVSRITRLLQLVVKACCIEVGHCIVTCPPLESDI